MPTLYTSQSLSLSLSHTLSHTHIELSFFTSAHTHFNFERVETSTTSRTRKNACMRRVYVYKKRDSSVQTMTTTARVFSPHASHLLTADMLRTAKVMVGRTSFVYKHAMRASENALCIHARQQVAHVRACMYARNMCAKYIVVYILKAEISL